MTDDVPNRTEEERASARIARDEFDLAFPSSLPLFSKAADGCPQGLTKRELFAAMLMQGLVAANAPFASLEEAAQASVVSADTLLKELAK